MIPTRGNIHRGHLRAINEEFVGSVKNAEMDLHLDSCTDITLISYEYYESLATKPSIKQGMRLQLWQLTDKD